MAGLPEWLPNLRTTVVVDPDRAVDVLHRRLTARPGLSVRHRVDALGLLAETYLRLDQAGLAADTALTAGQSVQGLDPGDWYRRIVVHGIIADIAVRTGTSNAGNAASDFYACASVLDPRSRISSYRGPFYRRLLISAALLAVAVYRTDRTQGHAALTHVHHMILAHDPGWTPGLHTITAGLHTMHPPRPGHLGGAVAGVPPPMPGGYLHPHLDYPAPGYLTDRITAAPTVLAVASAAGPR